MAGMCSVATALRDARARHAKIAGLFRMYPFWCMPLPPPVNRTLRHTRAITAEAFLRDDGLWDLEARLVDTKPRDLKLLTGVLRPQGTPLHELWLRVTIDTDFNIVDAAASSDWTPYPGCCESIEPAYRKLIGLNLLQQFRAAVRSRLGGTSGCTHLTELCSVLPTTAFQAFAGEVIRVNDTPESVATVPPPQLNGCHALAFGGDAVREFFPRWYGHQPGQADASTSLADRLASGITAPREHPA